MEVSPDLSNDALKPSVTKIDFGSKQIFSKDVDKISVKFDREEDMLVLCLSTFIHDFAHDFNFSTMHQRILKKNQPLFHSMGINIGNGIIKKYILPEFVNREIIMYDDTKFKDIDDTYESQFTKNKKNYYEMLRTYEEVSSMEGGAVSSIETAPEIIFSPNMKNLKQDEELEIKEDEQPIKLKQDLLFATNISEPTKEELEVYLEQPLTKTIKDTSIYVEALKQYTNDADFLTFFSSLTTYVANYMDCYNLHNSFKDYLITVDANKDALYNLMMFNAITSTIQYIADDFIKADMNGETYNDEPIEIVKENAYLFLLLLISFEKISKKKNNSFLKDSLEIFNSKEVLQQFIIYYVAYLSYENYDEFLSNKKGGEPEETIEIAQENSPTPILETPPVIEEEIQIEVPPSNVVYLSEKIAVTHNNLLTTITRGIFTKLGIWDTICKFKGVETELFSEDAINYITFDVLKQIYPIDPTVDRGNLNNELLIAEIIILKQLLLELSPFKMYVMGAKIDDRLKDYMDAFYYANYNFVTKETNIEVVEQINKELDEYNARLKDVDEIDLRFYDEDDSLETSNYMKGGETTSSITDNSLSTNDNVSSNIGLPLFSQQETISLPPVPIVLSGFKNAYDVNIQLMDNLIKSKIPPLQFNGQNGSLQINNLYDLLKYNQTLMSRINDDGSISEFGIQAPKMKFVINNAARLSSNINGVKFVLPTKLMDEIRILVDKYLEVDENGEHVIVDINIDDELTKLSNELEDVINGKEDFEGIDQKKQLLKEAIDPDEKIEIKDEIKTIERLYKNPLENEIFLLETLKDLGSKEKMQDYLLELKNNYENWFRKMQPFFGVYKSLNRGVFCPASSMMDAMDNCSLRHGTSEPKEVGTTNYELIYESGDKKISYGGTVLYYDQQFPPQLNANVDFRFICVSQGKEDIAVVSTNDIQVSESRELNARVAYRGVIEKLKLVFASRYKKDMLDTSDLIGLSDEDIKRKMLDKLSKLWNAVQYTNSVDNFNQLLGSTSIKTLGDFLQECQATVQWGGYVSRDVELMSTTKDLIEANKGTDKEIVPIYRSVSEGGKIVPYDNDGNALRLGVQGDRPSGFRSIYILLNASSGINEHCITGYMFTMSNQKPSRTLLVSRNIGEENNNKLKGMVIYVNPNAEKDRFNINLESTFISAKASKDETSKDETSKGFKMATQPEIPQLIDTTGVDISLDEMPKLKKARKTKKNAITEETTQNAGKKTKRTNKHKTKITKKNKHKKKKCKNTHKNIYDVK